MRAVYFLSIALVSVAAFAGVRERQYPSGREFFIRSRFPEYPFEARRTHQEGTGRFRLYIDKAGRVTEVKMLQSTGHALLDASAVKAMMSWQAPAGLEARDGGSCYVYYVARVSSSISSPHRSGAY